MEEYTNSSETQRDNRKRQDENPLSVEKQNAAKMLYLSFRPDFLAAVTSTKAVTLASIASNPISNLVLCASSVFASLIISSIFSSVVEVERAQTQHDNNFLEPYCGCVFSSALLWEPKLESFINPDNWV